jgi:hypothetical protein
MWQGGKAEVPVRKTFTSSAIFSGSFVSSLNRVEFCFFPV